MSNPNDRCIEPDCVAVPHLKGRCLRHYRSARQRTSDGVVTGGRAKLSAEQCAEIRRRSAGFATRQRLASDYGVTPKVITDVLKRTGAYAPKAVSA